jgi:hypothetical protein
MTDDEKREWFDKGQLAMQARIVAGLERWWRAAKLVAGRYWNEPHAAVCKVREIDHTTTEGRP